MSGSGTPDRGRLTLIAQLLLQTAVFGVLFFGLAEIVARVAFGFLPVTPAYFIFDYHPRWGWSHQPNAKGRFVKLGFQQDIAINSRGLREREIPYEKAEGLTRVLVIGDSNVAAFEVRPEETWTRVTESLLREKGYNVEFVNAGHRAWGTDQSLLFLMDEGIKYKPDLVLYYWSGNDAIDITTVHRPFRKYGKPYFELAEGGELSLKGVPVPRFPLAEGTLLGPEGKPYKVDVPAAVRATLWFRDNVIAVSAFATAMVYAVARLPGGAKTIASKGSFGDFKHIVAPEATEETYAFRLAGALVREMRRVAADNGARFYMLGTVDRGWTEKLRDYSGLPQLRVMERYRDSVPMKDGERDFSAVKVPFDPHWNALGQRMYSQILAPTLVESGLLTGDIPPAAVAEVE